MANVTSHIFVSARYVRQNESLRYCHDVRPSVRLSGTGVHCDQMVHFSADLSLWLDSPMFWAPWHQDMSSYSQPFFQFHLEVRLGMDVQTGRRCKHY